MTIALLNFLGVCIVQIQCVREYFLCTKIFQSLGRSEDQCPQCTSTCQVRNIPFEKQTNPFFLECDQRIYNFDEFQKTIRVKIGDFYCPGMYFSKKSVSMSIHGRRKMKTVTNVCNSERAATFVLNIHLKDQEQRLMLFANDGTIWSTKIQIMNNENEKPSPFLRSFPSNHNQAHLIVSQKKIKNHSIYGIILSTPH